MAQISFEQAALNSSAPSGSKGKVGFFSLANDKDEAIVRIMHDSVTDFELLEVHPITLGNKYPKVDCLRKPGDSIDACPLCRTGVKLQTRMYVHLVQYTIENGQIVATPKVWDRPISYATELKTKLEMYGPLSDSIFIIKRHGAAGDLKTTYSIDYAPPAMYPGAQYPKVTDAFAGYSAVGTAVFSKSKADLEYFVANGTFPAQSTNSTAAIPTSNVNYTQPATMVNPVGVPEFADANVPFMAAPASPIYEMPTAQPEIDVAAQQAQRPVRYY